VEAEGGKVLIDSGTGALGRLAQAGVSHLQLEGVVYTHLHPDHTAELVPLLFANNYAPRPRMAPFTLKGGPGFRAFFEALLGVYEPWLAPKHYALAVDELGDGARFRLGGVDFLAKPVQHSPSSLAFRLATGGRTLVVSGDTDFCQEVIELARGADLLVLECAFPDAQRVEGHLTPSLAGRIAEAAGCRRLLLTHFYAVCEHYDIMSECKDDFSGEVILAEDLLEVVV